MRNFDSQRPARSGGGAGRGARLAPGWRGDDVAEPELGPGHHLGVGVRGQPQVVLGASQVGVPHVARQVGQRHRQVRALLGPAAQVGDGEPVPQRVRVRAAGEVGDASVRQVAAEPQVDGRLVDRPTGRDAVEHVAAGLGGGMRGRDVAGQGRGEPGGDRDGAALAVLGVADPQRPAAGARIGQGQVKRLGNPQAGAIEHTEQDRVDQGPVRVGGHGLGVDRGEQAAHLLVGEDVRGLVADADPGCRGRGEGLPPGRPGVLGQLAQRQRVAADGEGSQVTAIEEPVDRFLGDGPVRVALLPAVGGELAQHPFLVPEPVPARVARGDQLGGQALQRPLSHCPRPPLPG